jgi:hypothetical protein
MDPSTPVSRFAQNRRSSLHITANRAGADAASALMLAEPQGQPSRKARGQ